MGKPAEREAFELSPDEMKSKDDVKVFRFAFFPMFFAIVIPGVLMPTAFWLSAWMKFGLQHFPFSRLVKHGIFTILFIFVYSWVISLFITVRLTQGGIHGHSFWAIRRMIRWEEIKAAKPFRFLNIRFLRLYPLDGKTPIWMPLFLAKPDEFEQEVRRVAPAGNPILEHLQKR
jgi:hypothetical protein